MHKELYIFNQSRPIKTVIRNYNKSDFIQLVQIQAESFPPPFPSELWWNEVQLQNHINLFPEGALCAEINGELAGSMTGVIVSFDLNHLDHTWEEMTDNGYIGNHNPDGNTLYVVDLCIRPKYRKLGLGKWLMQSMYELVVHKGLDRLLGGSRIPGFQHYVETMNVEEYVEKVVSGELWDPVVSFLLKCGRTPIKPVKNYLKDSESCDYGLLMEWKNPFIPIS